MPPVSSRTNTRSTPSRISGLSTEASRSAGCSLMGRRLAYTPSSRRRRSSPCSGRTGADGPHFGPPMAPNNTASAARQASSVAGGSGSPVRSMAMPPNGASSSMNSWPKRLPICSSTRTPSATTSGPMPSPAMTAIFAFTCWPSSVALLVRADRRVLRQQEAELVDAIQQAVARESFERKFHLRCRRAA